jgi:flagellar basal-body rod modification protein FlgD
MSQINAATSLLPTQKVKDVQSMDDLDSNDFLQLMITQLQQQDPLNPMDNNQMVQQISSIRELSATTKLTSTLDSVQAGQNIATASSLIGKSVDAIDDSGNPVTGVVGRVTVAVDPNDSTKRTIRIHVGDQDVQLQNIRSIEPSA